MYDFVIGVFIVGLLYVLYRLVGDMIFGNTGKTDAEQDSAGGCKEDVHEASAGSAPASRLGRGTGPLTQPVSDLDAPPAAASAGVRTPPRWVWATAPYAAPVGVATSIVVLLFS